MSQGFKNFCVHCKQSTDAQQKFSHAADELLNIALENSKLKSEVEGLRHELKMSTSGLPGALKRERMKVYDHLLNIVDERVKHYLSINEKLVAEVTSVVGVFIKTVKELENGESSL